jgi:uracil-DNA glycosylase family 4
VKQEYPQYHAAPVAPFGDPNARLLVVGLAPGMHGANASGRPFTGDFAGVLLYQTLFRYGFSNRPESTAKGDGLELIDCRITNAVKCLPPGNKPTPAEVAQCNPYLAQELAGLKTSGVVVALGVIAQGAVVRALGLRPRGLPFAHGAEQSLPGGRTLLNSYHCSRYNTQTRRLSQAMFEAVFARARALLGSV